MKKSVSITTIALNLGVLIYFLNFAMDSVEHIGELWNTRLFLLSLAASAIIFAVLYFARKKE